MSLPSFVIVLALLACAVWFVTRPLIVPPRRKVRAAAPPDSAPAGASHADVLLALRDLEFDHQIGKVTDADYALLHAQLVTQAAATLKQDAAADDDRIEAQVRARRQRRPCLACGRPLRPGDRFCPACGAARGAAT